MNILHVIASADPRGGGPIEGIRQRGLALQALGHQPEVLTLDDPGADFLQSFPLPVHAVGPAWGAYRWAPAILPWLRAHAHSSDAIVISGLWQYHAWATSRVLRKMGVRYWVFTHGMLDPWFRYSYPLKHLKKQAYWQVAERHVLEHAQAVLFTSEDERLRARESFSPYILTERVVDYGTNPPPGDGPAHRQAFRDAHPALVGKTLLLYLGRIHEKKGCDLLVHAFARLAPQNPYMHLVMAGPATQELQTALHAQAAAAGVADRITWLGMVQGAAKWQALFGCDAFVLPSHQENFGIAVVEALGCGLPVLVSDKVNTWREMVADGAALVAPDTAEGTIAMLQRWMDMPPALRFTMAEQARKTFADRYTASGAAISLLSALQQQHELTLAETPVEPMRILHVVTSVDPALGGVAESIRSRGVKLVELGHTVEVVSMDEPAAPFVSSYELPLTALGSGFTHWQYHPRLVPWLRDHCRRFDAVVVDGLWQYHGTATRRALRGTGVPYFVFPHGMLDPWFKRAYPLKHLKKWLFWPWSDYLVLRDAKAVLFTCEEERRLADQSFWLYQARGRVAPLGTAEPPPNGSGLAEGFHNKFPALRGKPFLLFLGRLHPKKGCDLLLNAFASVAREQPEHQLVMAGPADPTYRARLQAHAEKLRVAERVHWLGMLNGDTKWGALYSCEAFVLMSHQENFGLAVVEALACGKPVLISDKVNIWREIAADAAGLVESDTAAGAIAAVQRWVRTAPASRKLAATNARKTFEARFTVIASAQAMLRSLVGA